MQLIIYIKLKIKRKRLQKKEVWRSFVLKNSQDWKIGKNRAKKDKILKLTIH